MLKQVNARSRAQAIAEELRKIETDLRDNLLNSETTPGYRAAVYKQMRCVTQARTALDKLAV